MRLLIVRAVIAVIATSVPAAASAETLYAYCTDRDHSNVISSFFTYEGIFRDFDEIKNQWEQAVSAQLGIDTAKITGRCFAATNRDKAESYYENILGYTDEVLVPFAPISRHASASPPEPAAPRKESAERVTKTTTASAPAAERPVKRRADYEAEFQARRAEYERKLAQQQKQVEDYRRAQDEVVRTKAEQQAKADSAAAAFKAKQEAYAETVRQHEAKDAAAKQLLADFDKRHGPGQGKKQPSTNTDANRCVTTGETKLNATFQGNTAASILNGCGQPVDVRICLLTSTKGWNCGVGYGVASQGSWSWSSFNATGPVFVDARVSGSSRPLASPS